MLSTHPFPHLYIESIFHSMLAEQGNKDEGNWGLIKKAVSDRYNVKHFYELENNVDRAYIVRTRDRIIISISGTKSPEGWVRNAKAWSVNGWHYGFLRSFTELLLHPVTMLCKGFFGKIVVYGHSAGSAIALRTNYYLKKELGRDVESITYCGPQAVNRNGRSQCKKAKVCNTTINVDPHDPVDDIGKIAGGVEHGYIINLPDIGTPGIHKLWMVDNLFYGHAPSYVCKALVKLFHLWGMNYDKEIDEISQFAIK